MSSHLHTITTVHSVRHLPSWWLLSASAGAVNSTAFKASERFVSHMSGTATRIGLGGVTELVGDALVILLAFIVGAVASVLVIAARERRGAPPGFSTALVLVSAIIVAVAIAGRVGWLSPFDSDEAPWAMLLPLSFSMGLMNATVAAATGALVRTTHVTGPATDLGVHIGRALLGLGEGRAREVEAAVLRAGKVAGFILGAAAAVPLAERFEYLAFLPPAAAILLVTVRSLSPRAVHA